jgi:hypothetical protein
MYVALSLVVTAFRGIYVCDMAATWKTEQPPEARINGPLVWRIAVERGWKTVEQIAAGLKLGAASTFYRLLGGDLNPTLCYAREAAHEAGVPLELLFPEPARKSTPSH